MKLAFLILTLFIPTTSFGQTRPEERKIIICSDEKESIGGQLVLTDVDTPPVYSKGRSEFYEALHKEVKIPKLREPTNMYISIYISFIVDTTGKPRDICAVRRDNDESSAALEAEVIRALKAIGGDWVPGEHEGKKVPVRVFFPMKVHYKK